MRSPISTLDFHVRGEIPKQLEGSLLVACSRRIKDRRIFSRWHDSQADLLRIEMKAGRPGKARAHLMSVDPCGDGLDFVRPLNETVNPKFTPRGFYATQPNHGINVSGSRMWATNLLFGAPLEVDLKSWRATRVLRYLAPNEDCPQSTSTSHFAWSLDHRYAYFHESLFRREAPNEPVLAEQLILIRFDTKRNKERVWRLLPPKKDARLDTANFHSAFYYEMEGRRFVGLLRTGALLEHLAPHTKPAEHPVIPMPPSTIWVVEIDDSADTLEAKLLPGLDRIEGLALSHLDVDALGGNGFVLYANYKQADVAEETHGENLYGEPPEAVLEHYAGMVIEALDYGLVLRYELRPGMRSVKTFARPFDPCNTEAGHSWLPINLAIDSRGDRVFGTFSGFHPRLLPKHVADAYPGRHVNPLAIRYVPPLLLRFDAATLKPDCDQKRRHLSYAEPIAMTVVGDGTRDFVCTFSPEVGLRIYDANDLSAVIGHATCHELWNWQETHFRPDPAHMQFVPAVT
jgi:hypothetical protein